MRNKHSTALVNEYDIFGRVFRYLQNHYVPDEDAEERGIINEQQDKT